MFTRRNFLATLALGSASGALGAATPRIRIGQIGTQHAHAAGKMEAVRALPDLYEIVGVAGTHQGAGGDKVSAKAYEGVTRVSEDALLEDSNVKAVLIETRIEDSCAAAMRAIQAGKHIHLDKPGGLEHEAFKTMRLEAERRKLTVQMGYMLRYNPAFELLFRAHKAGWLGEILEVDAMMGKLADPIVRRTIGELPGGGMFELACHVIDAAVTLLGRPSEIHSFSTPTRPSDSVQDNQLAVLAYPKATVSIRCNHADPFGGPRRRFQVAGTKGAMEILPLESGRATLWLSEDRGEWKKGANSIALPTPKGRYDAEFVDLAAVVRGEKPLSWSSLHDVTVHETVLRASGVAV